MGVIPVTCSITASFMSAITLIGMPAEIYTAGTINYLGKGSSSINFVIMRMSVQSRPYSYDLVNILSVSFLHRSYWMTA